MVKERYKDDSLDIADAGEKVKALINEHLIDWGSIPRSRPSSFCRTISSPMCINIPRGTLRSKQARWSTHIRKHCAIHFDEAPAFYKRLSQDDQRELLEIVEVRYDRNAAIVTSQLPIKAWHDAMQDPTLADAILDRLVHDAYMNL